MTPTEVKVLEIVADSDKLNVNELARKYGVATKTITRILHGQTWSKLTGISPEEEEPPLCPPRMTKILSLQQFDLQDSLFAVRNYFGFDHKRSLQWARYDSWDGPGYLATDGLIAWNCEQLCMFVQELERNDMADAEELPTFGASRIMCRSVGECVDYEQLTNACPLKVAISDGVYLAGGFAMLARLRGMEIRRAVGETDFVYLTRARSIRTADDASTIHAAIATVKA